VPEQGVTQPDEVADSSVRQQGVGLLLQLQQKRQETLQQASLTLPVPRWSDPTILVTYRPLEHEEAVRIGKKVEKIKDQAARDLAGASDQLIAACLRVEAVIDGERYSLRPGDPEGEPTRFDDDLAENLGVAGQGARATVRALFITSPDLLAQARHLVEWSGYQESDADEAYLGE
jgi:hypothetical protein